MNKNSLIEEKYLPKTNLNDVQKQVVSEINEAILNGKLRLTQNHCMCGNDHEDKDVLISDSDFWGISIGQVICSKCGLIRNRYVFFPESNELFYENYYRKLYNVNDQVDYNYYKHQIHRGQSFVELLKELSIWNNICYVAELGCGAGGVLLPFSEEGKSVVGVDLNGEFLELGKKSGLNLKSGYFKDEIADGSCDLIIMSHVLEHFINPIDELVSIIPKIKQNKYLLIQVPGLFSNPKPNYPLSGFQVAHVFYFYKEWLLVLLELLGLDVLYCDDVCTFVCQKNKELKHIDYAWSDSLKKFPGTIKNRCMSAKLPPKSHNITKKILYNIVKKIKLYIEKWMIK